MKKTFALLSTLVALCMTAQAAVYTWAPVNSSTDWGTADNWQTDGGASTGIPLTNPNWGTVNISGNYTVVCGTSTSLEGWESTLNVSGGANVTIQKFAKFQKTTLNIGEDSVLSIGNSGGSLTVNVDTTMNWAIYGTLNLTSSINWNNSGNLNVDLGSSGILNLTNQSNLGQFSFSASLGNLITEGTLFQLVTRELVTGLASSVTTSNMTITGGTQTTDISSVALNADNVGTYQTFTQDGKVYVTYVNGVPEPATASLSLLGLAALMLRRRRS